MRKFAVFAAKYLYALGWSLYLFTAGILHARNRALISRICAHFGNVGPPTDPVVPVIEVTAIATDDVSVQIRNEMCQSRPEPRRTVRVFEAVVIAKIIQSRRPLTLFEIGTFEGRTTLSMAANSPPEAIVYTLDLSKGGERRTKLRLMPGEREYIEGELVARVYPGSDVGSKIIQLYGDSANFDFAPYYNSVDFVFVDGSHSYEYVLNDSWQALRMLRNGRGIILWHDYNDFEGVTRALNELFLEADEFRGLRYINGTHVACLVK